MHSVSRATKQVARVLGGYEGVDVDLSRAEVVRWCAALVLALAVFYPALIQQVLPLRLVAIAFGVAALSLELHLTPNLRYSRTTAKLLVIGGAVIILGAIEIAARSLDDRLFAVNAEHLLLLAPLFGGLGWMMIRSQGYRAYRGAYLGVAALTAVLAGVEFFLGRSLFGFEEFLTSQRGGPARVLLGSEQVLVLGALFAVGVALAATIKHLPTRVIVTILLVAACFLTGSRAPLALAIAVAVVQAMPPLVRLIQRLTWALVGAAGLGLVGLGWASVALWSPDIPGETGLEYSSNYRWAIYSLAPMILVLRPLGYLLMSPPRGVWMMNSELRGPVDLVDTVDSELVFAILGLGWLGLALYVAVLVLAIRTLRYSASLGFATLLLTGLGILLALHGWDAMSNLWYVLLGASAAVTFGAAARSAPVLEESLDRR